MITFAQLCRLPRLTNGCLWHGYRIVKTRSAWKALRNGEVVMTAATAGRLAEKIHCKVLNEEQT